LAGLPVINPDLTDPNKIQIDHTASPAFWSPVCGILTGVVDEFETPEVVGLPGGALYRFGPATAPPAESPNDLLVVDQTEPYWIRLGPYYAQAIVSYRDQLRYASDPGTLSSGRNPLWAADLRNASIDSDGTTSPAVEAQYRLEVASIPGDGLGGFQYGAIRRGDLKHGFLSLGELLNVKGFDCPVRHAHSGWRGLRRSTDLLYNPLGQPNDGRKMNCPDFFKAVSLMALLDTHFLTTRSNTFTVYMTLMNRDPEQQHSSIRVQYTVDRSNLLPRLATDEEGRPLMQATQDGEVPVILRRDGLPEIITRREAGYYDMRYDQ
jgi:hypothetical protein